MNDAESYVEIGCGAGESSKRLYKMIGERRFVASEYDSRYIEYLRLQDHPFNILQENVYHLSFGNSEYDCVIMLEVLEHLERPDDAIVELARVASRHLIISVPDEPLWRILNIARGKYLKDWGNTPGHINHYSVRSLAQLLQKHGLSVEIYRSSPWIIAHAKKGSSVNVE